MTEKIKIAFHGKSHFARDSILRFIVQRSDRFELCAEGDSRRDVVVVDIGITFLVRTQPTEWDRLVREIGSTDRKPVVILDFSHEGMQPTRAFRAKVAETLQETNPKIRRVVYLTQNRLLFRDGEVHRSHGEGELEYLYFHGFLARIAGDLRGMMEKDGGACLENMFANRVEAWRSPSPRFVCLMARPREHRIVVMGHLIRTGALRHGNVSFLSYMSPRYIEAGGTLEKDCGRARKAFPRFSDEIDTLAGFPGAKHGFRNFKNDVKEDNGSRARDIGIGGNARKDTQVELVLETEMTDGHALITDGREMREVNDDEAGKFFRRFTEKSLKAPLVWNAFLVCGNRSTLPLLEEVGISETGFGGDYDSVRDPQERLKAVLDNFDDYLSGSLKLDEGYLHRNRDIHARFLAKAEESAARSMNALSRILLDEECVAATWSRDNGQFPKAVVIHVGMHRTGTTYIQQLLNRNRATLPDRVAIFSQGDGSSRALHRVCQDYQKARQNGENGQDIRGRIIDACHDILGTAAPEADTILISDSEIPGIMPGRLGQFQFYPRLKEIVAALVEGFAPNRVTFVVYTRATAPWIRSVHNQAVKQHGLQLSLSAFRGRLPREIDLTVLAESLREAVGAENSVRVIPFEQDMKAEFGLGTGLLLEAGLSNEEIGNLSLPAEKAKQSLPRESLSLLRRLNATGMPSQHIRFVWEEIQRQPDLFEPAGKIPPHWRRRHQTRIKIDRVFYINLDQRTDRREHMEKMLSGCLVPVERVPGIVLDADSEEFGMERFFPKTEGTREPAGLWLASKSALERALKTQGDGAIVVFEDDVWLPESFLDGELTVPGELPDVWDILLVSPYFYSQEGRKKVFLPIFFNEPVRSRALLPFRVSGAHFIIFKDREAIRRILKSFSNRKHVHIDSHYTLSKELETFVVSRRDIYEGGFGSDISPRRTGNRNRDA